MSLLSSEVSAIADPRSWPAAVVVQATGPPSAVPPVPVELDAPPVPAVPVVLLLPDLEVVPPVPMVAVLCEPPPQPSAAPAAASRVAAIHSARMPSDLMQVSLWNEETRRRR